MAKIALRREGAQEQGEVILFEKGKYRVKLMGYEQVEGVGKSNGKPWSGLRVSLKFQGGEHDKHEQDFMLFDGREPQLTLFEAAGYEVDRDSDEVDVDLDSLVGLNLNTFLEVNKAGTYNNVVRFEPVPVTPKKSAKSTITTEDEEGDK